MLSSAIWTSHWNRRCLKLQAVNRLMSNTPDTMILYITSDIRGPVPSAVNAYINTFVKPGLGIGRPQSLTFPGFALQQGTADE